MTNPQSPHCSDPGSVGPWSWVDDFWCDCTEPGKAASTRSRWASALLQLPGSRRAASLQRLSAALSRQLADARALDISDEETAEIAAFRQHMEDARRRWADGDPDEGWASLAAARRVTISVLKPGSPALKHLATSLKAEVENKLSDWRKAAALELLESVTCERESEGDPDALRCAQFHLDEHSANVFRRLAVYRAVLWYACMGLLLAEALFLVAIWQQWLVLEPTGPDVPRVLDTAGGVAAVAMLGALGSLLSVALTQGTARGRKLPELLEGFVGALLRPVVGSASAIVLVLAINAEVVAGVRPDRSMTYVWAVLAGFSERLLRRTLNGLTDEVKSAESPTTRSA